MIWRLTTMFYLLFAVILVVFRVTETHVYLVDDVKGTGRQFDGIGGLSGGGVRNYFYIYLSLKF